MENLDNKFIELFEDLYDKKYQIDNGELDKQEDPYKEIVEQKPKSFFDKFKKNTKEEILDTSEVKLANSFDIVKTYLNDADIDITICFKSKKSNKMIKKRTEIRMVSTK